MPPAGFEPAIPAIDRPQVHALNQVWLISTHTRAAEFVRTHQRAPHVYTYIENKELFTAYCLKSNS